MRKTIIFTIALFFCLKVSAFVPKIDSSKLSASSKPAFCDNCSFFVFNPDGPGFSVFIKPQDNLIFPYSTLKDSLRAVEVIRLQNLKYRLKYMGLDSLKHELTINKSELLKGPLYSEIALRYLNYDTISNKKKPFGYLDEALNYTMKGLHQYSKFNDSTGLRISFDNLAKIYSGKRDFAQAKWFILQSNTLSRLRNDQPNIIASLITLAGIKMEIEDYDLAIRDLDEALHLTRKRHDAQTELIILNKYIYIYNRMNDYATEAKFVKKRDSLENLIRKGEQARLATKAAENMLAQRNAKELLNKKKVIISNYRIIFSEKTPSLL